VWPLIGLYGLWLVVGERREGTSWRSTVLVCAGFVALAVLWFVPEYIGSGEFLRSASRAREPVAGSPAETAHPFLSVFTNGAAALSVPVYVGAVAAVVLAVAGRPRDRRAAAVIGVAVVSVGLMVIVAALAQNGFTGNRRYVLLPAALVCVLAGVGWVQLAHAARGRWGAIAAGVLTALVVAGSARFVIDQIGRLGHQLEGVRAEARRNDDVPNAIARAGGRERVLGCGEVYTDAFSTAMLSWYLDVHQLRVGFRQRPPGTTIEVRGRTAARDPRFPRIAASRYWVVGSSCAR
jgi:MFS family permease